MSTRPRFVSGDRGSLEAKHRTCMQHALLWKPSWVIVNPAYSPELTRMLRVDSATPVAHNALVELSDVGSGRPHTTPEHCEWTEAAVGGHSLPGHTRTVLRLSHLHDDTGRVKDTLLGMGAICGDITFISAIVPYATRRLFFRYFVFCIHTASTLTKTLDQNVPILHVVIVVMMCYSMLSAIMNPLLVLYSVE